jgi:hypothetical protein
MMEIPMADREQQVDAFFKAYAKRSDDALHDPPVEDIGGMVTSFASYFVGSGPAGVMGGANDDKFRAAVPQGNERYRALGGKAFRLESVRSTELDALHVMARVDWAFDYERNSDGRRGTITFQNIYLLTFASGEPKVFAFITPDEQQALKDHGLL